MGSEKRGKKNIQLGVMNITQWIPFHTGVLQLQPHETRSSELRRPTGGACSRTYICSDQRSKRSSLAETQNSLPSQGVKRARSERSITSKNRNAYSRQKVLAFLTRSG